MGFDFYRNFNALGNQLSTINTMYANLDNLTTPGYKIVSNSFEELMNNGVGLGAFQKAGSTNFTQGKVRKTGGALDLALRDSVYGNPCSTFFVLSDGHRTRYTRTGHFNFKDGSLVDPFSHLKVQGFALDEDGNKKSDAPQDISLPYDPDTKLYGGMYTGFKFGEGGKLYGTVRITDPLTHEAVTKTVPMFQVALASFSDPTTLAQAGSTTFETGENSAKPVYGVSGEGSLTAQVSTNSLEMSNVDIPTMIQNIMMAKLAYDGQMAAFKSEMKMVDTATGLVR